MDDWTYDELEFDSYRWLHFVVSVVSFRINSYKHRNGIVQRTFSSFTCHDTFK